MKQNQDISSNHTITKKIQGTKKILRDGWEMMCSIYNRLNLGSILAPYMQLINA